MAALWPVFGLIVLTMEWVVLRRLAPRLEGRSRRRVASVSPRRPCPGNLRVVVTRVNGYGNSA